MTETMNAFYLHGAKDMRPQQTAIPQIDADQVLVKVKSTGICGTDIHYYHHGRNGDFVPERPFILGHECAGEIVDSGAFGATLPVGSRVAIDPAHPCGVCTSCRQGAYNHCPDMRYFGSAASSPPFDGSFRDYVPARAGNCHLIPDDMSFGQAALLEPLSIALHGLGQAGQVAGLRVLITGARPIGQLFGLVARHYGAERLAVSDLRPAALDLAADLWADFAIRADQPEQMEEADNTCGGFDVVIEASGAAAALQTAYQRCKAGGTIVQVGVQAGPVELPVNLVMQKELTVRGSFRFAHIFAKALDLLATKKLDLQPIVTGTFDFADLVPGLEAALGPDSIKVVINY
jgi:L-idonate 5-dehydrogenase